MNSNDLDILRAEYREKSPGEWRTQKWKKAVRAELSKSQTPARRPSTWLQLAVAMLVGVILGGMYFGGAEQRLSELTANNNYADDATYEFALTKSE